MVVSIKHLFVTAYPSLGGAIKPAPAPAEPAPFSVGDIVRLRSNNNPYKGTLKCGQSYMVHDWYSGGLGGVVRLGADNGSIGYFRAVNFELYTQSHIEVAAEEYEQAILAQEIMEQQ